MSTDHIDGTFPSIYQRNFSPGFDEAQTTPSEVGSKTGRRGYVTDRNFLAVHDADNSYHYVIPEDRKLGYVSTALLIINRMVGTGIFTTPGTITRGTSNMGMTLFFWIVGGVVSGLGLVVYLEFGMALPRSGGEKVYLERIFRSPKYLATCAFAVQFISLQVTTANVLIFTNYMFLAASGRAAGTQQGSVAISSATMYTSSSKLRGTGFCVITAICLIHAFLPRLGIYIGNALGSFKIVLMMVIICTGFAALSSDKYFIDPSTNPHNFAHFSGVWNTTRVDDPIDIFAQYNINGNDCKDSGSGAAGAAIALAQVIFAFTGWENANYVLGEVKNAPKTLKRSAPIAVLGVTILYVLVNVAYFAVLSREEIVAANYSVAVAFFSKLKVAKAFSHIAFPVFIALSALGNLFAATFALSRAKQEIAKEGVIPFPKLWASDWPRQAPSGGLLLHWIVTVIYLLALAGNPAGYTFLTLLATYSRTILNVFIGGGLLWLQYYPGETWREERTEFHVWWPLTLLWTLFNIFLVVSQFLPNCIIPTIHYYIYPTVGVVVFFCGIIYWFFFSKVLPMLGFELDIQKEDLADGSQRIIYTRVSQRAH